MLANKIIFSPIRRKHGGTKQFKLAHQGKMEKYLEPVIKLNPRNNELCLQLVQFRSKCENLPDGNCKKVFLINLEFGEVIIKLSVGSCVVEVMEGGYADSR